MTTFARRFRRHYLPRVRPLGRWIPAALFLVAMNSALQATTPAIGGWLLDRILADPAAFVRDWLGPSLLGLLALTLGYAALEYAQKMFATRISVLAKSVYQRDLYRHLLALDEAFYLRSRAGDISTRLTKDITEGLEPMYWNFAQVLWCSLLVIFGATILFSLHWALGAGYLIVVLVWALYANTIMRRTRGMNRELKDEFGRLNARVTEDLTNQALIRVFAKESDRASAFRAAAESYRERSIRLNRLYRASHAVVSVTLQFVLPLMIIAVCVTALRDHLTAGEVLAAFGTWMVATQPLEMFSRFIPGLMSSLSSMDRVFAFFEETPEVGNAPDARPLVVGAGAIRVEGVHFAYPGGDRAPVLHGVDLEIPAGTRCAIVGESGSGKSTLAHLLLRFYDPTAGRILVDGQDLRHVTQHSLRRQVGLVQQDSLLWAGTLRDNLRFVRPEAGEDEMWDALEKAELAAFVRQTPQGLDTLLGERGVRLSGGQRQRLALARLFLLAPAIIVLDEATSALDGPAERAVQRSVNRLAESRRTLVIIAHRLSTIVDCEQIVLLDRGRIVATGSHAELLTTCAAYRDLCAKQGLA